MPLLLLSLLSSACSSDLYELPPLDLKVAKPIPLSLYSNIANQCSLLDLQWLVSIHPFDKSSPSSSTLLNESFGQLSNELAWCPPSWLEFGVLLSADRDLFFFLHWKKKRFFDSGLIEAGGHPFEGMASVELFASIENES